MTYHLNDDFRDMLAALADEHVRYLVVGGYAVGVHAAERATKDIDILVRPDPENATRVMRALVAFGAPVATHDVGVQDFSTPGTIYQIGIPPRRIDLLTRIAAVDFDAAWSRRVVVQVDGLDVTFIGLDDLARNKQAVGRPADLADLDLMRRLGLSLPKDL